MYWGVAERNEVFEKHKRAATKRAWSCGEWRNKEECPAALGLSERNQGKAQNCQKTSPEKIIAVKKTARLLPWALEIAKKAKRWILSWKIN